MAVGTGGGGAGGAIAPPPPIFCQPKKFKSLKITTYKQDKILGGGANAPPPAPPVPTAMYLISTLPITF